MDAPKLSATEAEQMIAIIPDAPPVMQVNLHRPPTKSPTFCARDAKASSKIVPIARRLTCELQLGKARQL